MNHGSLGYLNEEAELSIEHGILNSLCLGNESKLYGVYYPCPPVSVDKRYKNSTLKHDFMLTPIPYRLWAVSARVHIHMLQKAGSMNELCEYFNEKNISIIHAESSRSGHRYATWSLHIAFENLLSISSIYYNKEKHFYEETNEQLEEIKTEISERYKHILFEPDYFPSVEGGTNSPLAYFSDYEKNKKKLTWIDEKWLVEPFELTLNIDKKSEILVGDSKFKKIINYLKFNEEGIFPATTFSELHLRALNIRTVVIPPKESKRFFMMGVEYERVGGKDTCVGLMHTITNHMTDRYSIWQSYNYTIDSSPEYDKGNLVFLMEDTSNIKFKGRDNRSRDSYVDEAKEIINEMVEEFNKDSIKLDHPSVIPLPDSGAIKRLFETNFDEKQKDYEYDVFISYSHSNKEFVNDKLIKILNGYGLNPHAYETEIRFGESIDETLRNNILNSREMCVVVSIASNESEWVTTEWGAAWILGKKLTPIVIKEANIVLPKRLERLLYVNADSEEEIEKYAKQLVENKYKSEAERFRQYFSR